MGDIRQVRLAVLIDDDNVSPESIGPLLQTIEADYGVVTIKRAYGNDSGKWKAELKQHRIDHIDKFADGKNSTDFAMTIDAMDLLHAQHELDGFCIVSNDGDFTHIVKRLRKAKKVVYACGVRSKMSKELRAACSKVISLPQNGSQSKKELKAGSPANASAEKATTKFALPVSAAPTKASPVRKTPEQLRADEALVRLLTNAVGAAARKDGWADLVSVRNVVKQIDPKFTSKNYGYARFSKLMEQLFKLEMRGPKTKQKCYIRLVPTSAS